MRDLAGSLFILAGFASFLVFIPAALPWLLPPLLLFLFSLDRRRTGLSGNRQQSRCSLAFIPFASGLLIWPMRLFYWDRGDFVLRVRNLLVLAVLFAFYLLARDQRWGRRFLRRFNSLALKKRLLAIFIVAEALFILGAALLTRRGVALAGDEPHYLAISQSLARDGDLNVFNQYFRDGYKEFLDVEKLPAHGTWGRGYKKIYSYHLPGLSLTLIPFFFLKLSPPLLYFLIRAYLGLFGAALALLAYLFALRLWRSRSLAFFVTLVFTLTAPVFFYSFHVFPEVQAMLLVLGALYILLFKTGAAPPRSDGAGNSRALWAGLLLGAAIFWGVKYALFIYPLTLGFCAWWLWRRQVRPALLLLIFPLFFQALFFLYLHGAYGTFSPNAVYYGMLSPEQSAAFYETILKRITPLMRWETLLDYFFDQRDGLLLYNPFYFFALPGLLLALKNIRRYRLHLLVAAPAMLFILNHAFSTIRAGYCPQGRYLAPVAWALMLLAVIYYRESRNRAFRKAFLALPCYAFFVSAYQALEPLTLYQPTTHDTLMRTGRMFQDWSSRFIDLPSLLPSFIKTDNRDYLPNTLFLLLFVLLAVLALTRSRTGAARRAGAIVPVLVFLAAFTLSSLFPRLGTADPQRILGPRDLPCRVYFDPPAQPGGEKAAWLCRGRACRLRIETMVPLKSIELRLHNRSDRDRLAVDASLFDGAAQSRELAPRAAASILLAEPRAKRLKARYGYQIVIRARDGKGAGPAWRLGLALR